MCHWLNICAVPVSCLQKKTHLENISCACMNCCNKQDNVESDHSLSYQLSTGKIDWRQQKHWIQTWICLDFPSFLLHLDVYRDAHDQRALEATISDPSQTNTWHKPQWFCLQPHRQLRRCTCGSERANISISVSASVSMNASMSVNVSVSMSNY